MQNLSNDILNNSGALDTNIVFQMSFSRLIHQVAQEVFSIDSPQDAEKYVKYAIEKGSPVNFRGAGHSFGDHCISDNGVLLINRDKSCFERIDEHHFNVSGGFTWRELEARLNAVGRRSPVLTNWLGATVAGTMAYGGFGVSSYRWGSQVDNVTSIGFIDGRGERRQIDRLSHPDEWSIACCSSGRLGFITNVVLRSVPAAEWLDQHALMPRSAEEFCSQLHTVSTQAQAYEMVMGQINLQSFKIVLGRPLADAAMGETSTVSNILGIDGFRNISMSYGDWLSSMEQREFPDDRAYLWADYVVPHHHFEEILLEAHRLAFLAEGALNWRPRIRVLCLDGARVAAPLQLLAVNRMDSSGTLFGVGLYLEPEMASANDVSHCRAILSALLRRCKELGGRPYLSGWHEGPPQDAMGCFGADLRRARMLLSQQPNNALINPGTMPAI